MYKYEKTWYSEDDFIYLFADVERSGFYIKL